MKEEIKMRKKLVSWLLTVMMILSLIISVPMTAYGADEPQATNIIVANTNNSSIDFFDISANGNIAPARTLKGASTNLNRPVDIALYDGELYVLNHEAHAIEIFDPLASGDTTPVRRIIGGMSYPSGFDFDPVTGEIYVANYSGNITVYNITDSGTVTPKRTIAKGNTMTLAVSGNELFVTTYGESAVYVYNNVTGELLRTISGTSTGFSGNLYGVAISDGELYIADSGNNAIKVFNTTDSGNVAPKRIIAGGNTLLGTPREFHIADNKLYVANNNSVTAFNLTDGGDVAPVQVLSGAATTFNAVQGVTVAEMPEIPQLIQTSETKMTDFFPKSAQGENGIYLQSRDENSTYYNLDYFGDYTFKTTGTPWNLPLVMIGDKANEIIKADPSALNQVGFERDSVIRTTLNGDFGWVRVTGSTQMDTKGSARFYIYKGEDGYSSPLWEATPGVTPVSFDLIIPYTEGDELFFSVDAGANDIDDWAIWKNIHFAPQSGPFSGGVGTEEDPYLISTEDDLFELAQKTTADNSFIGKYFIQTNDIEITTVWTPIGWRGNYYDTNLPFEGYYNGQSYSISELNISSSISWAGLFAVIGANGTLEDINLEGVSIIAGYHSGALVGENRGLIKGCNTSGSISGAGQLGGLVGMSHNGLLEDCHSSMTVIGTQESVGGLVGYSTNNSGNAANSILRCSSTGDVTGIQRTGGLVGTLQGGLLSESFALGSVSSSNNNTGGLVGVIESANGFVAEVKNSYARLSISSPNDKSVGGMFGANYWGTVSNCYAASSIAASGLNVGGLTGMIYSGTITSNSYYDADLSGTSDIGKGTPKSTDEMKQISTYNNWSFPDVWTINAIDNDGYPALAWQGFPHVSLSDDADLSGLSASGMTITPVFDASVTSYSANVTNNISSTTITAISASESATVKINGTTGNSREVPLNVGSNLFTVVVTAEDGETSKTYTININRESYVPVENQKPVLTSDWNYTTVYFGQNYPFTINVTDYESTPNTLLYSYIDNAAPNQSYNFSVVPGTVNITLSPLKGVLSSGSHTLNYYAVDAGGAVSSVLVLPFTIVEKTSSEASLSSISLTDINLTPAFNSGTLNYTSSVSNSISSTTVTAIAVSETATVKINGVSGNSKTIPLNVGSNLITLLVTAEDGETLKTYTIDITREDSGYGGGGGSSYRYYTITAKAEKGGKISPSGNISVGEGKDKEFTVTANEGDIISDVIVDGKSLGAVGNYIFKEISKAHTITARFIEEVKEELEKPESYDKEIPFTDVSQNDWFANDVMWAFEKGLMNGTSSTTFDPHGITTRGMIVTILYRLEGSPSSEDNTFIDVESGKYYANAVAWAAKNEIVKGYGNGKFGPEDPITREQLAVILVNYAKYKGYDVASRADLSKFTDFGEVSIWADDAMSWASFEKLIQGDGNKLMPAGNAERAQAAAIFHRFMECITSSSN